MRSKAVLQGGTEGRRIKVSDLVWLCVFDQGEWLAVFRLTDDQLREFRNLRELMQQSSASESTK